MITEKTALTYALAASLLFWLALLIFGALRPEYSHATKAISELGVVGAPNAVAFNILGFLIPGTLVALSAAAISQAVGPGRSLTWWMLVMSGCGFALTAIPAEMNEGSFQANSILTQLHFLMTLLAALPWLVGMFLFDRELRASAAYAELRTNVGLISLLALLLASINPLSGVLPITGAEGQRIAFVGFFGWFVAVSALLHRRVS